MCVGARVCSSERRVSLEVSSDACTGGGSRDCFYINFYFCLVIFYICILICFLPKFFSMEECIL